ncbi:Oxysterol-binding protein 3, partial [Cryomyces antarcticus]
PHKKSINFGIFKHPGTLNGVTPNLPSTATFEPPPTPGLLIEANTGGTKSRRGSTATSRNDTTTVVEKLKSLGLKPVAWTGKCEADKVSMGRYEVPEGEGGMYGLVFDNTFSKQVSKTATFVLMTHPTDAPPKSGHHLHYSQAFPGGSSTT